MKNYTTLFITCFKSNSGSPPHQMRLFQSNFARLSIKNELYRNKCEVTILFNT